MANDFTDLPDGLWEDGTNTSAMEMRRGGMVSQTAAGTNGVTTRGGVRPGRGNPLGVSLPGGMFARVAVGVVSVPTASEGAYVVTSPASVDLQVTAANGVNPRIDTVGIEVVPGSPTTFRLRMLDGTAQASPVAPTYSVPGGVWFPLADVRVNAAASVPASVTDRRQYTAGPGAVIPRPGLDDLSKSTRDAAAAALPVGTPFWDDTNQSLSIVSGSRDMLPIYAAPTLTEIVCTITGTTQTNTTPTTMTASQKTFTAPRSGWCYQGFDIDVSSVSGYYGAVYAQVLANGVIIPDGDSLVNGLSGSGHPILLGSGTGTSEREATRWVPRIPYWVEEGQTITVSLKQGAFANGGHKFNSLAWKIAVV